MDLQQLKLLGWYSGLSSITLTLIWIIIHFLAGGKKESPEDSKWKPYFHGLAYMLIICAAVIAAGLKYCPSGTGGRGAIAAFIAGFILPAFAILIESLSIGRERGAAESASGKAWAPAISLSPIVVLGTGLFILGAGTKFYGIGAVTLWYSFLLGLAIGMPLLKVGASRFGVSDLAMEKASQIEGASFVLISIVFSFLMCGYHFWQEVTGAWLTLYFAFGIFLAWFVSTLPIMVNKEKPNQGNLLLQFIIFIIVFLGIAYYVNTMLINNLAYFYPVIIGIISALLASGLACTSASKKEGDFTASVLSMLIFLGAVWAGFKLAKGYGISLVALGLISTLGVLNPYKNLEFFAKKEETGKPALFNLFYDAILLIGVAGMLIVGWRIFLQGSGLAYQYVDLSNGNIAVALLLGIIAPLLFQRWRTKLLGNPGKNIVSGWLSYILLTIVKFTFLFFMIILFKTEGLSAFIFGICASALMGLVSLGKKEFLQVFSASFSSAWVVLITSAMLAIKYFDKLESFTRKLKMEILIAAIVIGILVELISKILPGGKEKP